MAHTGLFALGMYLLSKVDRSSGLLLFEACAAVAGVGFGGAVSTLSLTVQNSVPHAVVGAATSALQFFRSLGGMMGMAIPGAAMTSRFTSQFEASMSGGVLEALSPETIERLKAEPEPLLDPDAAERLQASLGPELADGLLDALQAALASALQDVFALVAALAALAFVVALFLRVPAHSASSAP